MQKCNKEKNTKRKRKMKRHAMTKMKKKQKTENGEKGVEHLFVLKPLFVVENLFLDPANGESKMYDSRVPRTHKKKSGVNTCRTEFASSEEIAAKKRRAFRFNKPLVLAARDEDGTQMLE